MSEFLRLEHVSFTYNGNWGETPALRDVSFNVIEGEFVAIIGPEGCGKSTLLSLIAGLLAPSGGCVYINGTSHKNSGKTIGYMLQTDQLLEWQNKLSRVIPCTIENKKLADNNYLQINEGINSYGIISFINSYPSSHPESVRQRTALIKSLLKEPDLLLLDEPFSALNKDLRMEMADDIWQMLRSEKKTVILVAEDVEEAICLADRVIVLSARPATVTATFDLHLLETAGKPSAVYRSPEYASCYETISKTLAG